MTEKERIERRKEKLKLKYEAAKSEAEKIVIKEGSNAYSAREQKVYTETEEERKARREKRKKEKLLAYVSEKFIFLNSHPFLGRHSQRKQRKSRKRKRGK